MSENESVYGTGEYRVVNILCPKCEEITPYVEYPPYNNDVKSIFEGLTVKELEELWDDQNFVGITRQQMIEAGIGYVLTCHECGNEYFSEWSVIDKIIIMGAKNDNIITIKDEDEFPEIIIYKVIK